MIPDSPVQVLSAAKGAQSLRRIEEAAQRELEALRAAHSPSSPPDALWATLAWDMGLGGRALED